MAKGGKDLKHNLSAPRFIDSNAPLALEDSVGKLRILNPSASPRLARIRRHHSGGFELLSEPSMKKIFRPLRANVLAENLQRTGRGYTRRQFIRHTAGVTAALGLGAAWPGWAKDKNDKKPKELPKPQHSGVEHVIVVMMENRSFDHFLGWLPGANGRQAGLSYADTNGMLHPTIPL